MKGVAQGVQVAVQDAWGRTLGVVKTDDQGHFSLPVLPMAPPAAAGEMSAATNFYVGVEPGSSLYRVLIQQGSLQQGNGHVVCDAPQCRSGDGTEVGFGATYPTSTLVLSGLLVVEDGQSAAALPINVLTTLQDMLAREQQLTAARAGQIVQDLFGLSSPPAYLPPSGVDLTDPEAVARASVEELVTAVLNAAVEQDAYQNGQQGVPAWLDERREQMREQQMALERERLLALRDAAAATAQAAADAHAAKQAQLRAKLESARQRASQQINDAVDEHCDGDLCLPAPRLSPAEQSALNAAKALVAQVRGVAAASLEVFESGLDPAHPDHDPDTLPARLQQAGQLLGGEYAQLLPVLRDVMQVAGEHLESVVIRGEPDGPQAIAELARRYAHNNVPWWVCEGPWMADYDACVEAYVEAFASRFIGGQLMREGQRWQLQDVSLRADDVADSPIWYVALALEQPRFSQDGDLALGAGPQQLPFSGTVQGDGLSLQINSGSALDFTLGEAFAGSLEAPGALQLTSVDLVLDAVLAVGDADAQQRFTGRLELGLVASPAMHAANSNLPLVSPIPHTLVLDGRFEQDGQQPLVAALEMVIDNAARFAARQQGGRFDDRARYAYDPGLNEVTLTLGTDQDGVQLRLHQQGPDGVYVDCAAHGKATCGEQFEWPLESAWFYEVLDTQLSEPACVEAGFWWSEEESGCIEWVSLTEDELAADLRLALRGWTLEEISQRLGPVPVTGEGTYQLQPLSWQPSHDRYGNDLFTAEQGTLPAYLVRMAPDHERDGGYLSGVLHARTEGRLAAGLPTMQLALDMQRTGYRAGNASLKLNWEEADQTPVALTFSTPQLQPLTEVTVANRDGTRLLLSRDAVSGELSGRIERQGQALGTVRREGAVYMVTWLDDSIESLY